MRVMVIGGTWFLGRRVVERLYERGDEVLVVHRGTDPEGWIPVAHLHCDRADLAQHIEEIRDFAPDAIVDAIALNASDVDSAVAALPEVPTVVLSSQDVYQAFQGFRAGTVEAAVPVAEDSALRHQRYPYRGLGIDTVPDDYEKLDVEERWLARGATVLRLPLVYGPHDWQRREDPILRRVRAGREKIPVGAGNLLWTRGHVDDLATGVLAALDTRAVDGLAVNLGEPQTMPVRWWLEQILAAAGSRAQLVRVPDEALPPDLAVTAAHPQHLLMSVARAETLLGWAPGDPAERIVDSVHWHLDQQDQASWSQQDTVTDDAALTAAS